MNVHVPVSLRNSTSVALAEVPELSGSDFRDTLSALVEKGGRIASFFALASGTRLIALVAEDSHHRLRLLQCRLEGSLESLTRGCPQAHYFEREIAEEYPGTIVGHPTLKPVRRPADWEAESGIEQGRFLRAEGEEIHEVGVGPVHAGVIEPGHFRFLCHGERVLNLEISLGYQHRGIEASLVGGPSKRTLPQMETLAGDTTIGHALAYCQIVETLGNIRVAESAEIVRAIALELERIANHVGDLGALSADVGYLPTAAQCGKLRGDFLNLTAEICGSRFGRGLLCPGGVRFGVSREHAAKMTQALARAGRDAESAATLLWGSPSVVTRFEGTGVIRRLDCHEMGFVGPAARACGLPRDVRRDHRVGTYATAAIAPQVAYYGDVNSRAAVRRLEIQESLRFVSDRLADLPSETSVAAAPNPALAPDRIAVSLVEGWRGEICHVALTDEAGRFLRYKVVDPSFHNWYALSLALRDGQISDFPLCNKSFNLSYCGHDL